MKSAGLLRAGLDNPGSARRTLARALGGLAAHEPHVNAVVLVGHVVDPV